LKEWEPLTKGKFHYPIAQFTYKGKTGTIKKKIKERKRQKNKMPDIVAIQNCSRVI
jgi:hypothetical protein